MLGRKRLALLAGSALAVSLIGASLGTTVANAAGRPTHAMSTAGRTVHISAAAVHGTRALPGLKPAHLSPATASTLGAGAYTPALVVTAGVTFTMPSFTCKSASDDEWLLPGLWIFNSSGALQSQVDVNFNCNQGSKLQEDVICISGGSSCDTSITPNPGDVIEAVYTASGSTAIGTLYDKTQGLAAQVTGTAGGESSILVGDLSGASFGVSDVPTFSKVPFSNASLNGFVLADWGPSVLSLKNASHTQIKSSAVTVNAFTTKFVHNT